MNHGVDPSPAQVVAGGRIPCAARAGLDSRARGGDAAAFSALYERHHQELFRYCRSIVRHEQDAQDALQSAMVKAFAALQREDRDLDMRPWLFRIAHNEAISLLRSRRDTGEMLDLPARGGSMDERLIEREDLRALQVDLADLSDSQRSALVLRELNGLGHAEIAQVLDSSARAVKQSIYEARSALLESREGREMACEAIRRTLSDADGRVMRGRRLRAHLRSCTGCRQFQADLSQRPRDLAALVPPLPAVASAALLHHLLAGSGKAASGTLSASVGGGGLAGALGAKAAITAALLVTAAGGTVVAVQQIEHHPRGDTHRKTKPGGLARPFSPRERPPQVSAGGRRAPKPAAHDARRPSARRGRPRTLPARSPRFWGTLPWPPAARAKRRPPQRDNSRHTDPRALGRGQPGSPNDGGSDQPAVETPASPRWSPSETGRRRPGRRAVLTVARVPRRPNRRLAPAPVPGRPRRAGGRWISGGSSTATSPGQLDDRHCWG